MSAHKEAVIALVANELDIAPNKITLQSHFIDDLNTDSIDTSNILNAVKINFKVMIAQDDAEQIETIQDLINQVEKAIQVQ